MIFSISSLSEERKFVMNDEEGANLLSNSLLMSSNICWLSRDFFVDCEVDGDLVLGFGWTDDACIGEPFAKGKAPTGVSAVFLRRVTLVQDGHFKEARLSLLNFNTFSGEIFRHW